MVGELTASTLDLSRSVGCLYGTHTAVDLLLHHTHIVMTAGESIRRTQATAGNGTTPLTGRPTGNSVGHHRAVLLSATGRIPLAVDKSGSSGLSGG